MSTPAIVQKVLTAAEQAAAELRSGAIAMLHNGQFVQALQAIEQIAGEVAIKAIEAQLPALLQPLVDEALQAALAKAESATGSALESVSSPAPAPVAPTIKPAVPAAAAVNPAAPAPAPLNVEDALRAIATHVGIAL